MPRVQYSNPPRDVNITKWMRLPRNFQDLNSWFKEARRAIPEIPNTERTDWQILDTIVTQLYVIYELRDSIGNKAAVIIERRASRMVA